MKNSKKQILALCALLSLSFNQTQCFDFSSFSSGISSFFNTNSTAISTVAATVFTGLFYRTLQPSTVKTNNKTKPTNYQTNITTTYSCRPIGVGATFGDEDEARYKAALALSAFFRVNVTGLAPLYNVIKEKYPISAINKPLPIIKHNKLKNIGDNESSDCERCSYSEEEKKHFSIKKNNPQKKISKTGLGVLFHQEPSYFIRNGFQPTSSNIVVLQPTFYKPNNPFHRKKYRKEYGLESGE
jgi:hypothetical protein